MQTYRWRRRTTFDGSTRKYRFRLIHSKSHDTAEMICEYLTTFTLHQFEHSYTHRSENTVHTFIWTFAYSSIRNGSDNSKIHRDFLLHSSAWCNRKQFAGRSSWQIEKNTTENHSFGRTIESGSASYVRSNRWRCIDDWLRRSAINDSRFVLPKINSLWNYFHFWWTVIYNPILFMYTLDPSLSHISNNILNIHS